jgi:hypothetical protein
MTSLKWTTAVLTAALGIAPAACADRPESDVDRRGDASYYDGNIHDFLPDYIDQHPMFLDDELDFWVKDGKVSGRGRLDSESERQELEYRLRRVPAVRDVDLTGVTIG